MTNKIWIDPGDTTADPTKAARDRRDAGKRERQRQARDAKLANIAVLDLETDPFDNVSRARIAPFLAVLYSDHFAPVVIWDDDEGAFYDRLMSALADLKEPHTIFAHNGGRFDYLFLLHRLRGEVSFKGSGIMRAKLGVHELRDSFHIIPQALKKYRKENFSYTAMNRAMRAAQRAEIVHYCIKDCEYLFQIVKAFIAEYGMTISVGTAAMNELKKSYTVKKIGHSFDRSLRRHFFGGRVQCLRGRGEFVGDYRLFDVNSMYPYVMATHMHPIGDWMDYSKRIGDPGPDTVFICCEATQLHPFGAFMSREDDGGVTTTQREGTFHTTIWEFNEARRLGLIDVWNINYVYDCKVRTDFHAFVLPLYDRRQQTKAWLAVHDEGDAHYWEFRREDTFLKLILNNAFGKFAINPRRFKEYWITDIGAEPPREWFCGFFREDDDAPDGRTEVKAELHYKIRDTRFAPVGLQFRDWRKLTGAAKQRAREQNPRGFWLWDRPSPKQHFRNVGVSASITGAARAILMRELVHAVDPIYCDTDSIVCKGLGPSAVIDAQALGAWKPERSFSIVRVAGKKQYAAHDGDEGKAYIRTKGVSGLTWHDFRRLLSGETIDAVAFAPTLDKLGGQTYLQRAIRATAELEDA